LQAELDLVAAAEDVPLRLQAQLTDMMGHEYAATGGAMVGGLAVTVRFRWRGPAELPTLVRLVVSGVDEGESVFEINQADLVKAS